MTNLLTITVAELSELKPGDAVILDCRFSLMDKGLGRRNYNEAHIPGAIFMDMEEDLASPVSSHGGRHPLPDKSELEEKLRNAGISADTLVVCYDEQRFAGAARTWWVLNYYGHSNVRLLDGGLKAWREDGLKLSSVPTVPRRGSIQLTPNAELIVEMPDIKARPPGILVDSREPVRYAGDEEPIDPVAGHIPGAVNYCWLDVTDENGFLKSAEQLQAHWAGITPGDDVVVYCGSGVTAAVNLMSMEAAGISGARLYPGSWSDWISWPENPVATKADPEGSVPVSD